MYLAQKLRSPLGSNAHCNTCCWVAAGSPLDLLAATTQGRLVCSGVLPAELLPGGGRQCHWCHQWSEGGQQPEIAQRLQR